MPDDPSTPAPDADLYKQSELYRELSAWYDNPDSFFDPNSPLIHNFRIVRLEVPGKKPDVLRIEVEGGQLFRHLREMFLALMKHAAEKNLLEDYQTTDWNQVCDEITADEEYLEIERQMYLVFGRNMPNLMVKLYNILLLMSVISAVKKSLDEPTRREQEPIIKKELTAAVRGLRNEIARMLEIRSPGRPTKLHTGPWPEIVVRVFQTAREMMGESRGKDAVPGLKNIADELGTNADALGKQLIRVSHPWTGIRT